MALATNYIAPHFWGLAKPHSKRQLVKTLYPKISQKFPDQSLSLKLTDHLTCHRALLFGKLILILPKNDLDLVYYKWYNLGIVLERRIYKKEKRGRLNVIWIYNVKCWMIIAHHRHLLSWKCFDFGHLYFGHIIFFIEINTNLT